MAYKFFSTGTGDPTRSLRSLLRQTEDGIPASGTFLDFYHYGGPVPLARETLIRQAIVGGSVRPEPVISKVGVDGFGPLYMGDLDAGSKAQVALFLSHLQGYTTDVREAGKHWRHRIGDSLRTTNQELNKLTLLADDDKGYATRAVDVIPNGFTLSIASRENVSLTVPIFSGAVDLHGDVVDAKGGAGNTGTAKNIFLRGIDWTSVFPETQATDTDVYITIDANNTATTVDVKVKVGTTGTPSAKQTITLGKWTRLYYGTASGDRRLGTRGNWVSVYFKKEDADKYIEGDVWKFPARRAAWTPNFGTEIVIPEVNCWFFLDGEQVPLEGGVTITASQDTVETRYTPGGEQPVGTYRAGFKSVDIEVSRRYVDLTLERKLLTSSKISFVVEAFSNVRITDGVGDYGYTFIAPECRVTGSTFSTDSGGTNRDEALTLQARHPVADPAFKWEGVDVKSDFEVWIDTDYATLP